MTWTYEKLMALHLELRGGKGLDEAKERKRRRILEVARHLFFQHGYRRTSVDEVARQAGIAKGTVYLYFKTKTELLYAVVLEEEAGLMERTRDAFDQTLSPRDRLRSYLVMMLNYGPDMPLSVRIMQGDVDLMTALMEIGREEAHDWPSIAVSLLEQLLRDLPSAEEVSDETLSEQTRVLFGLMWFGATLVTDAVRGGLSVDRYAEILTDMLLDGLCKDANRRKP